MILLLLSMIVQLSHAAFVCPHCEPVQMSSQNLAQQLALAPSRPPLNFKTTRIPLSGLDFCRVSHSGAPVRVLQISTGAVSGIINDLRKKDPQFDLLREVAVKIKNKVWI